MLGIDKFRPSSAAGMGLGASDGASSDGSQDATIAQILQDIEALIQMLLQRMLQQMTQGGDDQGDGGPPSAGKRPAAPPGAGAPGGAAPAAEAAQAAPQATLAPAAPEVAQAAPAAAGPVAASGPAPEAASVQSPTAAASGGDLSPQQVASTFKDDIAAASKASGVPAGILAGQIWQESKGHPETPGGGLMQLGDNEFQKYGGGNIANPHDNIMAGAMYMKDLMGQFGGSTGAALRAYNSGPNGVDLGNLNSTPAGTGDPSYVQKVTQAAQQSGLATA